MSQTRRQFRPEIRAIGGSSGRQFEAMPLAYEVVDDYGTVWTEGVFTRSVQERMPTLLYGHDWSDVTNVLGRAIDYRDSKAGPLVTFELTDFDAHPHTRQVAAQINDQTMVDMSVGFERRRWDGPGGQRQLAEADREMRGPSGVRAIERMHEAGWDETSLVVRGAVPGAKVLTGVRMVQVRGLAVPMDDVIELGRRIDRGEITNAEAVAALNLLGGDEDPPEPPPDPTDEDDTDGALAEATAVLEDLEI